MSEKNNVLDNRSDEKIDQAQLSCLLAALNEAQQNVRAYDTKSQIMSVGFIFSVTLLGKLLGNFEIDRTFGLAYLMVGFVLLIGPVALFGWVLYPTRRSIPNTMTAPLTVHHCLVFWSDGDRKIEGYLHDIDAADWKIELAYEIMRVSALRDLKRERFLMGLYTCGLSFLLILLGNILKVAGIT